MERARARGLLDLMQTALLTKSSPEEDELLDEIYRLRSTEGMDKEELRNAESRYQKLQDERLAEATGGWGTTTAVCSIEDVQRSLNEDTMLLAYALGDTTSHLWVVEGTSHRHFELPDRKTLSLEIDQLRDAMAQPGLADAALRRAARELYQMLMQPTGDRLGEVRHVILVPDGKLFELPFEVLLTEDADTDAPWPSLPFLARSNLLAYVPSATIFVRLGHGKAPAYGRELVAFGDPDFSQLPPRPGGSALNPLPATRQEVESIAGRLGANQKVVYLGSRATETALKREIRTASPRVLHLATHGLVDPVQPVSSCVALAPDPKAGDDGFLHTLEILNLPLGVELVVLSACESARGRIDRGEGVVGLSRSFLAAGARGVVASLWSVPDESTAKLMDRLYERMFDGGECVAQALNEARLILMQDARYGHPYFWSPFVVIGANAFDDHSPLEHES